MKEICKRVLFWTPRILSVAFAGLISVFAFDMFGENDGFWQALAGFLLHLIPTYIIVRVLILAWKWEWIGTLPLLH